MNVLLDRIEFYKNHMTLEVSSECTCCKKVSANSISVNSLVYLHVGCSTCGQQTHLDIFDFVMYSCAMVWKYTPVNQAIVRDKITDIFGI
jgi:hypothetical protein